MMVEEEKPSQPQIKVIKQGLHQQSMLGKPPQFVWMWQSRMTFDNVQL